MVTPGEGKGPDPAAIDPRNPLVGKKALRDEAKDEVVVAGEWRGNSSLVGVLRVEDKEWRFWEWK